MELGLLELLWWQKNLLVVRDLRHCFLFVPCTCCHLNHGRRVELDKSLKTAVLAVKANSCSLVPWQKFSSPHLDYTHKCSGMTGTKAG